MSDTHTITSGPAGTAHPPTHQGRPGAPAARAGWPVRLVYAVKRGYYQLKYRRLTLGTGVQIRGRIRLRRGVRVVIGDRCRINKLVRFAGPGQVTVGPDSLLNGSWIGCWSEVRIGAWCLLSDCQLVDNDFHHVSPQRRHEPPGPDTRAPIVVDRNVWIGAGALVLKGVHIGTDSVVGAATVVRSDVPARCVVIGNPQQVVKRFDV
ncbi:MAG: acyltransferase [Actinocatenispora sp.]